MTLKIHDNVQWQNEIKCSYTIALSASQKHISRHISLTKERYSEYLTENNRIVIFKLYEHVHCTQM